MGNKHMNLLIKHYDLKKDEMFNKDEEIKEI